MEYCICKNKVLFHHINTKSSSSFYRLFNCTASQQFIMGQKRSNEVEIEQLTEISHLQKYGIKVIKLNKCHTSFCFLAPRFPLKLISFRSAMAYSSATSEGLIPLVLIFVMISNIIWQLVDSNVSNIYEKVPWTISSGSRLPHWTDSLGVLENI